MKNIILNSSIEDIYKLTPLQEGMLYHNLTDEESSGYVIQSIFNINGNVEEGHIQEALRLMSGGRGFDI